MADPSIPSTMEKRTCKARKKDGAPCRNAPMRGSSVCYQHSLFRFKKIPFYRNATVHLIVTVILALIQIGIWIHSCSTGATQDNQQETHDKLDNLDNRLARIEAFNDRMKDIEKSRHEEFAKKFPLGYGLFAIDKVQLNLFPYSNTSFHRDYKIDWQAARIDSIDKQYIMIYPPALHYLPLDWKIEGNIISLRRDGRGQAIIRRPKFIMFGQVLDETPDGFICIVGLKEPKRSWQ